MSIFETDLFGIIINRYYDFTHIKIKEIKQLISQICMNFFNIVEFDRRLTKH